MSRPERCALCGSEDLSLMYADIRIADEPGHEPRFRSLWACGRCRAYWSLLPDRTGSAQYYRDKPESDHAMLEHYPRRFRRVRDAVEGALGRDSYRLLDIGCAGGAHFDVYGERVEKFGVEPSASSEHLLRGRGVVWIGQSVDDAPDCGFDAVTCLDVLEHVENPRALLGGMDRCVRPGGVVAVATGSIDSIPARLGGRRWLYLALPEHCSFYSADALRRYWVDERGYEPLAMSWLPSGFGIRYVVTFLVGVACEVAYRLMPRRALRALERAGHARFPFFYDNMLLTFRKPVDRPSQLEDLTGWRRPDLPADLILSSEDAPVRAAELKTNYGK
jgi:SAM-dependent methyltransferase